MHTPYVALSSDLADPSLATCKSLLEISSVSVSRSVSEVGNPDCILGGRPASCWTDLGVGTFAHGNWYIIEPRRLQMSHGSVNATGGVSHSSSLAWCLVCLSL